MPNISTLESSTQTFAIVVDSACDIAPSHLSREHVEFVPFYIRTQTRELKDCVELDKTEFFVQLSSNKGNFSIFNPRVEEYRAVFQKLVDAGVSDIVSLQSSSHLRGSYPAALQAASEIKGARVHVIDTKCISAQLLFVLSSLISDRDAGMGANEACEHALDVANAARFLVIPAPHTPLLSRVSHKSYRAFLNKAASLRARALGVRRVYAMNRDGYPEELFRAHEMHQLAGRIVRTMSLYSHEVGPLAYIEVNAGVPRFLETLEKPLDTNEFESVALGTIATNPSTTRQLGVGAVGVAYAPLSLVAEDVCARLTATDAA